MKPRQVDGRQRQEGMAVGSLTGRQTKRPATYPAGRQGDRARQTGWRVCREVKYSCRQADRYAVLQAGR